MRGRVKENPWKLAGQLAQHTWGGGKINTYIHTYKQKTKDILHETRNKVEDKDRHSDLHACTMHYDIYILSKAHAQRERGKGKERERNIVNTSTYRHRN